MYARKISENIAYGLDQEVSQEQIINAAKMANAHNFIMEASKEYDTECGERGAQLSGGDILTSKIPNLNILGLSFKLKT